MAYGDRPVSRLNRRRRFLPRADAVDEVDIVHEGVVDVPRPPGDFRAAGVMPVEPDVVRADNGSKE